LATATIKANLSAYVSTNSKAQEAGEAITIGSGTISAAIHRAAYRVDLSDCLYRRITQLYGFITMASKAQGTLTYEPFYFPELSTFDWNNEGNITGALVSDRGVVANSGDNVSLHLPLSFISSFSQDELKNLGIRIGYVKEAGLDSSYNQSSIYGYTSSYVPYLQIKYEALAPLAPIALSPNNTIRNPKGTIELSWQHVPNDFADSEAAANYGFDILEDAQSGATLRYRVGTGSWVTIEIANTSNAYTFPAGFFGISATSKITWQVCTKGVHNGAGAWSTEAAFTLGPTAPRAPVPTYPVNSHENASSAITFEWEYRSDFDNTPTKYDLTYTVNGLNWISVSGTNSNTYHIIGALNAAYTVQWRVRTYGAYSDVGPWSDTATFRTIGKPSTPQITNITNEGRPTIRWGADEFQSWQLQILKSGQQIYDTGYQPYDVTLSHKVPKWLTDGQYAARVQTKNEYGFTSDWGERAFTLSTIRPAVPTLQVMANMGYCVILRFAATAEKMMVYRAEADGGDYICVGVTSGTEYRDYTATPNVRYLYFVKAVNATGAFSDSEVWQGMAGFRELCLARVTRPNDYVLLSVDLDDNPQRNQAHSTVRTYSHYVGRELPVAESNGFKTLTATVSFFVTQKIRQKLWELYNSGEVLILRDTYIGKMYGHIDSLPYSWTQFSGSKTSFTFTAVDFHEEVDG